MAELPIRQRRQLAQRLDAPSAGKVLNVPWSLVQYTANCSLLPFAM